MKRKIFFLINSLNTGGAENVLRLLTNKLKDEFTISVITLKNSSDFNFSEEIEIIPLSNTNNNFLMIILIPIYYIKLKLITRKQKPYRTISFLEISNFLNILTNKKAIISFRTSLSFFNTGITDSIYLMLIKLLYQKANKIIVNSDQNRNEIVTKLNISPEKITMIHNPIDRDEIETLSNKDIDKTLLNKINETNIFITISRLTKGKRIDRIIETFSKISQPEKNSLLIIGDGEEDVRLREIAKNTSLKNIYFLGNQKNVFKYLKISNYFIFCSEAEGFPNVLIESVVMKIPIITTDFKTGARELIDPSLDYNQLLKYPYYGPNGVLLSLENFEKDFLEIKFEKILNQQIGTNNFEISNVLKKWKCLIYG